ncbi:MAG: thioredoxin family protein [Phycisphaerales bacterium]|nr:thioredoxin family protein [Phycisphaerales bacterium]
MKIASVRAFTAVLAALALGIAGIAFAQSGSNPSGARPPAAAQAPKVIALAFYADWCPGCKALKPKLEEVMKESATEPCLFIKLDQTDKDSHQAEYMVAALGIADLWKEHAGKTGYVLLVNSRTKRVVATLTADQDAEAMQAALNKAIQG